MIVVASSWNSLTTWHPAKAGALTAAASFVALAAILYRQLSSSNKAQEDSIPSPEGSLPFIGHLWSYAKVLSRNVFNGKMNLAQSIA